MTTSAHIALISRQEVEKLSREYVNLKTGDRLEGKVMELKPDGKVMVDFGKFQAALELKADVQKGDVISVVVVEKGKQIKLKLEQIKSRLMQQGVQQGKTVEGQSVKELHGQIDRMLQQEAKAPQDRGEFVKTQQPPPQDLKEALGKLKQVLENVESSGVKDIASLSKEIKNILDTLESHKDALDIKETVVKPAAQLDTLVRDSGVPVDKNVREILTRITQAAEKLGKLETVEQLPQAKRIIQEELKPALSELKEVLRREPAPTVETGRTNLEDVKKAVDQLLKNVENALEKLPDKTTPAKPDAPPPPETELLVKQVSQLRTLVENAPLPPEPETAEALQRLEQAVRLINRAPTPEQAPETREIIDKQIKPDLVQVKQAVQHRPALENVKISVDKVLENLEKIEQTLERLPEPVKSSEKIQTLLEEIKSIRQTLQRQSDSIDSGQRIAEETVQIKTQVEQSGVPLENQLETILNRLADAAEKISQIKSPEQLPELKTIIREHVEPNLAALEQALRSSGTGTLVPVESAPAPTPPADMPAAVELPLPPPTTETPEVREIQQRIEILQREIQLTLEKLPEPEQSSREVQQLLKEIDSSFQKITDFAYLSDKSPFPEDIETLFENIKLALKQLKLNIQSGKPLFDIPMEVRDIFANLELNFDSANIREAATQQITQLETLVRAIEDSGLSGDKQLQELLTSLKEILNQLNQLKDNGQWQQIRELLQKELAPQLQALKQYFSAPEFSRNPVLREQAAPFIKAVETMDAQIKELAAKEPTQQPQLQEFLEKAADLPQEVKTVLSELPKSLQTPENLSRLSENINQALAKYSEATASETTAAPSENAAASTVEGSAPRLPAEVRQMLTTLRSHFQPLDIGEGAVKLAPKLKSMVEDSGVFFEKKIHDAIERLTEASSRLGNIENLGRLPEIRSIIENDLKPNLLQLREFFNSDRFEAGSAQREIMETVKKAVDDLLSNIDSQQTRAPSEPQAQQSNFAVFSFNLPLKGEEEAQLKIFYNKNRKGNDEAEFKLSLLLEMDRLGEIRTDFAHKEKNLTITFYVKSREIQEYIKENLAEVREPLDPEFDSMIIKTVVSEEKIAQFESDTAEGIISEQAVDVKV